MSRGTRHHKEYSNADAKILNGNDPCTLCRNYVRFGIVGTLTLEFTRPEYVHQASFSPYGQYIVGNVVFLFFFLSD